MIATKHQGKNPSLLLVCDKLFTLLYISHCRKSMEFYGCDRGTQPQTFLALQHATLFKCAPFTEQRVSGERFISTWSEGRDIQIPLLSIDDAIEVNKRNCTASAAK